MVATLCLLSCVLTTAQPGDRSEWLLAPRLLRSQELVYRGTVVEEATGKGVQFQRGYRLEARVFVLDTPPQGADVALLTVLKAQGGKPEGGEEPASGSVRLELARVDLQGRVVPDAGVSLTVPLEGPPTVECGAFVEAPRNRVGPRQKWETAEEGRPARSWQFAGTEVVNGTSCAKLVGLQQSDDWDRPRADRTAWRRRDTVWLAPRLGIAYKVERVIERREPARTEPTQKATTAYELSSSLQYPGQLFEDRRREVVQARSFLETAAPLVANPGKYAAQLDALEARIAYHLDNQPPTPYRDAVLHVRRRVQAARRGELPPAAVQEPAATGQVATLGRPAPDFVVPDLTTRQSARLQNWLGKPIVLVFYNPQAHSAAEVLRFAQSLHNSFRQHGVTVLGLAVSDDAERVRAQRAELNLTFPILSGTGLRLSYAVEATPKLMVLDGAGVVRGHYTGWGRETADEVTEELRRWLSR